MLKIKKVDTKSIGQNLGLKKGDVLVSVDGEQLIDLLDYEYYDSQESFLLGVIKKNGKKEEIPVQKTDFVSMGLSFDEDCYLTPRCCANKCIFCFVDQLPKNLRSTLYVKDDDWRLSFASGTYVTLTNLRDGEKERIVKRKFSPLYISVHSTGQNRNFLLGNPKAPPIMPLLKYFADGGIVMHTQIVVCGGVNDGQVLQKSLEDLYELYPQVKSVAVVPVGLTQHRQNLNNLLPLSKQQAIDILKICRDFDKMAYDKCGEHFVFCSDEMYLRADAEFEKADFYGDYDQIENGVGLVTKLKDEFDAAISLAKRAKKESFSIVTGESAGNIIIGLVDQIKQKFPDAQIDVKVLKNNFFGHSVTVAGLLTGADMANQLVGQDLNRTVLVPKVMLREFMDVFLDGVTLKQFSKMIGRRVKVVNCDGYELVKALCEGDFYE